MLKIHITDANGTLLDTYELEVPNDVNNTHAWVFISAELRDMLSHAAKVVEQCD